MKFKIVSVNDAANQVTVDILNDDLSVFKAGVVVMKQAISQIKKEVKDYYNIFNKQAVINSELQENINKVIDLPMGQ